MSAKSPAATEMFLETLKTRTSDFFYKKVHPFWRDVLCKTPELKENIVPLMLTGIFLRLSEIAENQSAVDNDWNITPFTVKVGQPLQIVEKRNDGRSRRVTIWVDAAIGMPAVVMRVGTSAGSVAAGGFQVVPGTMNEIGKLPAKKQLFVSTDVPLQIFVIEES